MGKSKYGGHEFESYAMDPITAAHHAGLTFELPRGYSRLYFNNLHFHSNEHEEAKTFLVDAVVVYIVSPDVKIWRKPSKSLWCERDQPGAYRLDFYRQPVDSDGDPLRGWPTVEALETAIPLRQ